MRPLMRRTIDEKPPLITSGGVELG